MYALCLPYGYFFSVVCLFRFICSMDVVFFVSHCDSAPNRFHREKLERIKKEMEAIKVL